MKKRYIILGIIIIMLLISSFSASALYGDSENQIINNSLASGITISQVDYMFFEGSELNSDMGRLEINIDEFLSHYDIDEGYLNIYSDTGWVVQNLFVNTVDGMNTLSNYFNLGKKNDGKDLKTIELHLSFTKNAIINFKDGKRVSFMVGDMIFNAEGAGEGWTTEGDGPIAEVTFNPDANTFFFIKPLRDGENVQCARMQCFPMSVANSLQYLENSHVLFNIIHDHLPGQDGDNTIVGQLDYYSGRQVDSRISGGGVNNKNMLKGKFEYLNSLGLAGRIIHKHQGNGTGDDPPLGNFNYAGITSIDESVNGNVTFDWIYEQLKKCADVEIGVYRQTGGGHAVRVIGCGKTFGRPWIRYIHDAIQAYEFYPNGTCKGDFEGLEFVDKYVEDLDGDGTLNLGSENNEIGFALSEYIPDVTIVSVNGGFGITVEVENLGPELKPELEYEIIVETPLMFLGGEYIGTIDIPTGETSIIKTGFFFGFGLATITVSIWDEEEKISKEVDCFILGPFATGIK